MLGFPGPVPSPKAVVLKLSPIGCGLTAFHEPSRVLADESSTGHDAAKDDLTCAR